MYVSVNHLLTYSTSHLRSNSTRRKCGAGNDASQHRTAGDSHGRPLPALSSGSFCPRVSTASDSPAPNPASAVLEEPDAKANDRPEVPRLCHGRLRLALVMSVASGETRAAWTALSFAELLRLLRAEAHLTQEELAEAAGLSPRSISDLERGVSRTARKDTARLLADALSLRASERTAFVAAARGRGPVADVLTARDATVTDAAQSAKVLWYPDSEADGVTRYESRLGKLIDAIADVTSSDGRVVTEILLIVLTGWPGRELD